MQLRSSVSPTQEKRSMAKCTSHTAQREARAIIVGTVRFTFLAAFLDLGVDARTVPKKSRHGTPRSR